MTTETFQDTFSGVDKENILIKEKARAKATEHAKDDALKKKSKDKAQPFIGASESTPSDEAPLLSLINAYFVYFALIAIGHIKDFFGKIFFPHRYVNLQPRNVLNSHHHKFM